MTRADVQRLVTEAVTEALAVALKPAGEAQEDAGGPGPSEKASGTRGEKDDTGEWYSYCWSITAAMAAIN